MEDLDILLYVVLFIMGAIVAIADRAASGVKCKANGKIFKFYPIRHITTALAVIFAIAAFIYYGVGGGENVRDNVMGILGLALILITITFVYDLFLIFWRFNKKRADKKASGAAAEDETGEISEDTISADEGANVSDDDAAEDEKEGEKEKQGEDET